MDFTLRPFLPSDVQNLAKHANNPNIANNLTNQFPHPYTEVNAKKFIEMARNMEPPSIFAITIDNEVCGGIGIHSQTDIYEKNMELGYWLAEKYWGNGIISKAIVEIVQYGFDNFEITRIFARPYGDNIASQRVLEKAGFILEAHLKDTFYKNGKFKDELIYAIRRKI